MQRESGHCRVLFSPALTSRGTSWLGLSLNIDQLLQTGSPNGHPRASFRTEFENHGISHQNLGISALFEISKDLTILDPRFASMELAVSHLDDFLPKQPTSLIFFTCLAPESIEFLNPSGFFLKCCRVVCLYVNSPNRM